ncbi:MAG: serine hydrolase domain-containing protein, partial [Thermoanaerobaculia bacterium]
SLIDLLQRRVFQPLRMSTVFDTDLAPLGPDEPQRYMRYGLGPVRPAPKEGKGWMFAAGELAMTPSDLAKWDLSIIDQTILQPASYREMEKEVSLASGVGSRYGLGLSLGMVDGRRLLSHGGEVSGFTAQNDVYPDDRVSVSVLTNIDAASAASQIASKIGTILFAPSGTEGAQEQAKRIFGGLQDGAIDRTLFTSNANAYFSIAALKDFASTLKPLGMPTEFTQTRQGLRGGMTSRSYKVVFPKKTLRVWTFTMPDGKLEQYMVAPAE